MDNDKTFVHQVEMKWTEWLCTSFKLVLDGSNERGLKEKRELNIFYLAGVAEK